MKRCMLCDYICDEGEYKEMDGNILCLDCYDENTIDWEHVLESEEA